MPWPLVPGSLPRTEISPASSEIRPTMHLKMVVLPHPEGPNRPYLFKFKVSLMITLYLCI